MRVSLAGLATACAVLVVAGGCARSAEERQLEAMRDEIDKLQHDRDQENARAGLLAGEGAEGETHAVPPRLPAPDQRPLPDAVSLGLAGDSAVDEAVDPEDPAPRPSIRILGTPRPGGRGMWRGEDRVEQTGPADGAEPRPSALDPEAKKAYDEALALVTARKYDSALDAMAAFLVKWPDHPYADNAMYWRGECYFARGDYTHAAEQFEGVLTRFPAGNKAPDALLKLGVTAQRTGDAAKAREFFVRLAQEYPQSQAARRIPPATAAPAKGPGPAPEDHR